MMNICFIGYMYYTFISSGTCIIHLFHWVHVLYIYFIGYMYYTFISSGTCIIHLFHWVHVLYIYFIGYMYYTFISSGTCIIHFAIQDMHFILKINGFVGVYSMLSSLRFLTEFRFDN